MMVWNGVVTGVERM